MARVGVEAGPVEQAEAVWEVDAVELAGGGGCRGCRCRPGRPPGRTGRLGAHVVARVGVEAGGLAGGWLVGAR